jgi:hypothetical protein
VSYPQAVLYDVTRVIVFTETDLSVAGETRREACVAWRNRVCFELSWPLLLATKTCCGCAATAGKTLNMFFRRLPCHSKHTV